jgi:hypothetical protein
MCAQSQRRFQSTSVHELAGCAFGRNREGGIVALRVYLDGSGKENDHPVITVGGFLADSSLCEDIERDWEVATGGRVFHLAEFGTSHCALGSRSWSLSKRVEFLKRLASIVNRPGCKVISASIEVVPYNDMLAKSPHAHVNGPAFSGCAQSAVQVAEFILMKENRREQKVRYVFEKGDREHEVVKMMQDWDDVKSPLSKLRGYGFEPKETTLLQPADLIAGVIQKCMLAAYNALPCLDNGLSRTALHNYERHYAPDGVTSAIVSGHDCDGCWVINSLTFSELDRISTGFFERHPKVLAKRMKQSPFKPKQRNAVDTQDNGA